MPEERENMKNEDDERFDKIYNEIYDNEVKPYYHKELRDQLLDFLHYKEKIRLNPDLFSKIKPYFEKLKYELKLHKENETEYWNEYVLQNPYVNEYILWKAVDISDLENDNKWWNGETNGEETFNFLGVLENADEVTQGEQKMEFLGENYTGEEIK